MDGLLPHLDDHTNNLAYKATVRPCLEHACVVWNPHMVSDTDIVGAVQRRAANAK